MFDPLARHHGGSFAPPLTDELLSKYTQLAAGAPPEVKDAMQMLLSCVYKWWNLPESKGEGADHPSGKGKVVPLDSEISNVLQEHIPWLYQMEPLDRLFGAITDKPLRDAAHHLLWHVKELEMDREPITTDKL